MTTTKPSPQELKSLIEQHNKLISRITSATIKNNADILNRLVEDSPHASKAISQSIAMDHVIFKRGAFPRHPEIARFRESTRLNIHERRHISYFDQERRGVFRIGPQHGSIYAAFNLVDMLPYWLVSPHDSKLTSGSFVISRALPLSNSDLFVLTGPLATINPESHDDAINEAEKIARRHPSLTHNNPELLNNAIVHQQTRHDRFIALFDGPMAVDAVQNIKQRLRPLFLDDDDTSSELPGVFGQLETIAAKHNVETIGLFSHPRQGLGIFPRLEVLEDALNLTEGEISDECAVFVGSVLNEDTHSPLILDAAFKVNPDGFNRIIQQIFHDSNLNWAQDRDAIIAEHKPHFNDSQIDLPISIFDAETVAVREQRWLESADDLVAPISKTRNRRRRTKQRTKRRR